MSIEEIKRKLDPNDIKSLLFWQKTMHQEFEKFEREDELPDEKFLDLYDFIMHKIAWEYINSIES